MENTWKIPVQNHKKQLALVDQCPLVLPVIQVLANRDISAQEVWSFLEPRDHASPFEMPGMEKAVQTILQGISAKAKIWIYGDYDVDGITATAILVHFFRDLGLTVDYHIPSRFAEGYGINKAALKKIADKGCDLLITVDCGINSGEILADMEAKGTKVVVSDHHHLTALKPQVTAVINPFFLAEASSLKHLAGVGVAWKLIQGVEKRLESTKKGDIYKYLAFAALGTVADMVPLLGDNRLIVKAGMKEALDSQFPGLNRLLDNVGQKGFLDEEAIGYKIAPLLNSAGRIDNARLSCELLLAETDIEADIFLQKLTACNQKRKEMVEDIYQEALLQAEKREGAKALVLNDPAWHEGVLGIVAAKIQNRFQLPTFVFTATAGGWKGSARGGENDHILDLLLPIAADIERYGGHKQAAGLTVVDEKFVKFRKSLEEIAARNFCVQEKVIEVDAVVKKCGQENLICEDLQKAGPFGNGYQKPVFLYSDLKCVKKNVFGKKRNCVKLIFCDQNHQELEITDFSPAEKRLPDVNMRIDLLVEISSNFFRNEIKPLIQIVDWRLAAKETMENFSAKEESKLPFVELYDQIIENWGPREGFQIKIATNDRELRERLSFSKSIFYGHQIPEWLEKEHKLVKSSGFFAGGGVCHHYFKKDSLAAEGIDLVLLDKPRDMQVWRYWLLETGQELKNIQLHIAFSTELGKNKEKPFFWQKKELGNFYRWLQKRFTPNIVFDIAQILIYPEVKKMAEDRLQKALDIYQELGLVSQIEPGQYILKMREYKKELMDSLYYRKEIISWREYEFWQKIKSAENCQSFFQNILQT